jgi:hypothetical protein
MGSAFAVLALNDSGSPLRQGWRLVQSAERVANAATSAIALRVAGDTVERARVAAIAPPSAPGMQPVKLSTTGAGLPPGAAKPRTREAGIAAVQRAKPAAVRRPEEKLAVASQAPRRSPAERRPWPEAFMGLGATSR